MKNSLRYSSIVVLCGGKTDSSDESNFRLMKGCQSSEMTLTSSINIEKQIGSKKSLSRKKFRSDTVQFPLTWYTSDFENEEVAGLNLIYQTGKSISNKLFSGYRTNFMVLVDDQSEFDLIGKTVSGVNAIFLPNSDLISYDFSAQIGQIATSRGNFECDEAWLTTLTGYSGTYMGITNGQNVSKPFEINKNGLISGNFKQVYIPSGINVKITDRHNSEVYNLNISSLSVSINFDRNKVQGFGSNYDMVRNLKAPVYSSITMEIDSPYFSGRSYEDIPPNEEGFDISVTLLGTPLKGGIKRDYEFEFREALIREDSTPFQIGQRSINTLTFDIEDYDSDY